MIKANLTQKLSALLVAALAFASSPVQAQTPIWGAATGSGGAGYAEGTFSTAFATANADPYSSANLSATQWTAYSIWQCDAQTLPMVQSANDSAYWNRLQAPYDTTGHGPELPDPQNITVALPGWPSGSPGAANGLAIFDSDYLNSSGAYNGEHSSDLNDPTSCNTHKGELISPPIDLSASFGQNISINFYTLFISGTFFSPPNELTVSFSYDDGVTWHVTTPNIFNLVTDPVPGYPAAFGGGQPAFQGGSPTIPLPDVWAGYDPFAGHDNTKCRIKFSCEQRYYFVFIDEVSLISQPDVDFYFASPNSSVDAGILDQPAAMQPSNARYTPSNQVDMSQFLFGARVANDGAQTVTNVPVTITVNKNDSTNSSCVIYQDSVVADSVFGNDPGRLTPSDTFKAAQFVGTFDPTTLTDGYADYVVTYEIKTPTGIVDFNPNNNTINRSFSITDNYWSKVKLTNGFPTANAPVLIATSASGTLDNFIWGSVFYAASNDVLDSVALQYYVASGYSGSGAQGLKVNVYEWNDILTGTEDHRINNEATLAHPELTLIGDGLLNLTGLTAGQSYDQAVVAVREFPLGVNPINLVAGKRYLIAFAEGVDFGGNAFSDVTGVWFGGDNQMDYSYNMLADADFDLYDAAGDFDYYPNNTWPGVLYYSEQGGSTNGWGNNGFGGDLIPSLGLIMSAKTVNASLCTPLVTSVTDVENAVAGELMIYPNPTSTAINVEVNFEKEVANVDYRLTDVMGKVIATANSANVLSEVKTFDLQAAPAGVYFISIQSGKDIMTKRFIKK